MIWVLFSLFFVFMIFARKKKLWQKISESVRNAILGLIGFCIILLGINFLFIIHPTILPENESGNIKYAILLGGGITKDEDISENVKRRIEKASSFLEENPDVKVIVTGGKGKYAPTDEARVLKAKLIEKGISEERILCEDKAKDTIQNLIFSAELLAENENLSLEEILNSPIVIITSLPHLARAEMIAERLGYSNVSGLYSRTPAIFAVQSYLRETCAFFKLFARITFTRKPSSLISL